MLMLLYIGFFCLFSGKEKERVEQEQNFITVFTGKLAKLWSWSIEYEGSGFQPLYFKLTYLKHKF